MSPLPHYTAGAPSLFVTTRSFTCRDVHFEEGQQVLFDGLNATYKGQTYKLPFLRGAVRAGWLRPDE